MTTRADKSVEQGSHSGPSFEADTPPPLKFEVERTFRKLKRRPLEYIVKLDSEKRIVDRFFANDGAQYLSSNTTSASTTPSRSPFRISEQSAFRPVEHIRDSGVLPISRPEICRTQTMIVDPTLDQFWTRNEVLCQIQQPSAENYSSVWNKSRRRQRDKTSDRAGQSAGRMVDLPGPDNDFENSSSRMIEQDSAVDGANLPGNRQNGIKSSVDAAKIKPISYGPSIVTMKNGHTCDNEISRKGPKQASVDEAAVDRLRRSDDSSRDGALEQKRKNFGAIKRLSAIFDKSKSVERELYEAGAENDDPDSAKSNEISKSSRNLSQADKRHEFLATKSRRGPGGVAAGEISANDNEISVKRRTNSNRKALRSRKTICLYPDDDEKIDNLATRGSNKYAYWKDEIAKKRDVTTADLNASEPSLQLSHIKNSLYFRHAAEDGKGQRLPAVQRQLISRSFTTTNYDESSDDSPILMLSNVPYKINILNNIVIQHRKSDANDDQPIMSRKINTKTVSSRAQMFEKIAKEQFRGVGGSGPFFGRDVIRQQRNNAEIRKKIERAKTADFSSSAATTKKSPSSSQKNRPQLRVNFADGDEFISCDDSSLENLLKDDLYRHEDQSSRLALDEKAKMFESKWRENEKMRLERRVGFCRDGGVDGDVDKNPRNKRNELRRQTQPITMDEINLARCMAGPIAEESKFNYQPHRFIQTGLDRSTSRTSINDVYIPDYKVNNLEICEKKAQQLSRCKKLSLW